MKSKIYLFFKSAKANAFDDAIRIELDGEKIGIMKYGEQFQFDVETGNHDLKLFSNMNNKCYAKRELIVNTDEIYLTYEPNIFYKGKIKEVSKEKYSKKRKNDKLYSILAFVVAILIYIIIKLFF